MPPEFCQRATNESLRAASATADPDHECVAQCKAGNREAFEQLVLRHKDRLYTLALRFLGDQGEAEDVAQEAFLRAYEKLEEFRGEAKFSTWLYQICRNLSLHRLDKKKEKLSDGLLPEVAADAGAEPLVQLLEKERHELVNWALAQLQHKFREVIVLYHQEALSYEEIADLLELPLGTIRSRLHRGRRELQDLLRPYLEKVS